MVSTRQQRKEDTAPFAARAPEDMRVTHMPLLQTGTAAQKRAEILDYFHKTFSLYESLFECLADDSAFYARANPLRHPLIFYYGHTAVFFINKMNVAGLINRRVCPKIESLVAIGVDEMSWDDLDEKHYDWPTVAEIKAYRDETRAIVDEYIRTAPLSLPIGWEDPFWIVLMGIEHERIHLETSAVLIRELPLAAVRDHAFWGNICTEKGAAPANSLLPVAGGTVTLGRDRHAPAVYGWDNEFGTRSEDVAAFAASRYLVSNHEYRQFVEAGGYQKTQYWSDEGRRWLGYTKAAHPAFWVKRGGAYQLRTMLKLIDMPWNWPAEVNALEAKAFCNWKAAETGQPIRLPTEAECMLLRAACADDQPTWKKAPGNINLEGFMSACPVDKYAFQGGFYDIIGNVWQWTETAIDGLAGFEVHPAYDDFSTPTFDGKHNIFKGGCWISTGNYALRDARYAFRRHFLQNSGLRYVAGAPLKEEQLNVYETDNMVSQYIEFHYGDEHFGVPNFPRACADICLTAMQGRKTGRALDLGCATGRATFELARGFDHVDGIDFSARLIQAPAQLQRTGSQRYVIQDEGELQTFKEATLAALGLQDVAGKASFMQGDACNLPAKFTGYDLVFAGNLIDRLYEPRKFLDVIHTRINAGGVLVLASPYTWLAEFTARDKWVGGFKADTGENFTTLDGLKNILSPHFDFISAQDVPFVIRETRRKFQHTLSELSIWQRT